MTRPPFEPKLDPPHFPHQLEQAPQIRELESAAMFWQVGTGKTRTDIEDTMWQYTQDKIDACLVVAPVNVHKLTWVQMQLPQWCTLPNARAMFYESPSNSTPEYQAELKKLVDHDGLKFLTVYYQTFASKSGWDFVQWFARNAGRLKVTVDESHHIMSPGSLAATRLARPVQHRVAKSAWKDTVVRRIMTATPTGDGPQNLYSQYRFLDPNIIGVSTMAEFKAMFVREVPIPNTHFKRIAGYHNMKYLNKRIAPHTFVAKKPEGLPPVHYHTIVTSLSDEQKKHYDDIRTEYQTQLRTGHWVEAELAITRIKRLLQIAAGHLYIPNPTDEKRVREIVPLECPRFADCVTAVRGCPEKVIVWAEEHPEVERLLKEFEAAGVGAVAYYGGIKKQDDRLRNLHTFENDKDYKVLVANPQTGGEGFTVLGVVEPVSAQIFYSHNWSRILRVQAEGRNHRPGTKATRCTYGDMIGCQMDLKVRKRVNDKDDLAQLIADPRAVAALLDEDLTYEQGLSGLVGTVVSL